MASRQRRSWEVQVAVSNPFDQFDAPQQVVQEPNPFDQFDASAASPQDDSMSGAIYRGMAGRGLGILQTAHDVGKYLYGAKPSDASFEQASNAFANKLAQEGKGTGLKGMVGETAGDPLNWAPWRSLMAYGATAGATAPQTNDTGIGGRAEQAAIEAPVMAVTGKLAGLVAKPVQWAANKSGLTDLVASGLQKFGMGGGGSELSQLARQAGLDTSGKTPSEIADSLQSWYGNQVGNLATNISPTAYDPKAGFEGIAKGWTGQQQATNEAFKNTVNAGQGLNAPPANALNVVKNLDATIANLEGNTLPGTSEHTALQQLKDIRGTLSEGQRIPGTLSIPGKTSFSPSDGTYAPPEFQKVGFQQVDAPTLLDLRANMNEGYSPRQLPSRGDVATASTSGTVRDALNAIGETNKPFAENLQYSDANQANLGMTYKNNQLLQKFFKPEDLNAFQQAAKGVPLPDITVKRMNNLVTSIKAPEDLATVTKAMPEPLADSLRSAKLTQVLTDAGLSFEKLTNPQNVSIIKESLKGDPASLASFNRLQEVAAVLQHRKIDIYNPLSIAANSQRETNAVMAAWDFYEKRKAYGVRRLYRFFTDQEQNALTGLQNEITAGGPGRQALAPLANQIAPRILASQMKQTDPAAQSMQQPEAAGAVPPVPAVPAPMPQHLIKSEGVRPQSYNDTQGHRTIGIGFNMDSPNAKAIWAQAGIQTPFNDAYKDAKLSPDEIDRLGQASTAVAANDVQKLVPNFTQLSPNRQQALLSMSYQLGGPKMAQFKNMLSAIMQGNFGAAANRLINSDYYKETPSRVRNIARTLALDVPYNG